MPGNWDEVVTRYPYENVRMDHLLSREILRGIRFTFSSSVRVELCSSNLDHLNSYFSPTQYPIFRVHFLNLASTLIVE